MQFSGYSLTRYPNRYSTHSPQRNGLLVSLTQSSPSNSAVIERLLGSNCALDPNGHDKVRKISRAIDRNRGSSVSLRGLR